MIESELLSKIMQLGSLQRCIEKRVRGSMFQESGVVYEFILHHYNEYGEIPVLDTVQRNYPTFRYVETLPEPIDYYIDEVRSKKQYSMLTQGLVAAGRLITEDVTQTIIDLSTVLINVQLMAGETLDTSWTENTGIRFEEYEELERTYGMSGVQTPWSRLNELTMGWQNSHLVTIAGRPKTGKSWMIVFNAIFAVRNHHSVLFFSLEMSPDEIKRRADAVYCELPYGDFRRARLGDEIKEAYLGHLEEIEQLSGKLHITGDSDSKGNVGVSFLDAKIRQYNPRIVFIDGVYLMHDERNGKSKTEKLYNLTQDLKRVARRFQIPIVVTTQMGRGNESREGGASNIQWSDSFASDSDEMIELFQTQEMRQQRLMRIVLMTQREGDIGSFDVDWNLETMRFGENEGIAEDSFDPGVELM